MTRNSSEDETVNVNFFFTTTLYTYYKIRKLRFKLNESLQTFHHGNITLTVEFENNSE